MIALHRLRAAEEALEQEMASKPEPEDSILTTEKRLELDALYESGKYIRYAFASFIAGFMAGVEENRNQKEK